jgi:hypothetical protein
MNNLGTRAGKLDNLDLIIYSVSELGVPAVDLVNDILVLPRILLPTGHKQL